MIKSLWCYLTQRTHIVSLGILALLLFAPSGVAYAADGSIQSLVASDAPQPGDTFTVTAVLNVTGKINNSSLYYQIIAPDGQTVLLTHTTELPSLEDETYTDTWNADNSSFLSTGDYTVVLCWSNGGSQNCQIASKSTAFYSAPALGFWFGTAALGAIGMLLWRKRADFAPQERSR